MPSTKNGKKWYTARAPKPRPASNRLGPDTERAYEEVRRAGGRYGSGSVYLADMDITGVPDLPANTYTLMLDNCTLTRITRLPSNLRQLYLRRCPNLADLPETFSPDLTISIQDCPMLPVIYTYEEQADMWGFGYQSNLHEASAAFKTEWATYKEQERRKREAKAFCYRIREELMAAVMHPRRIEALIDAIGIDAIDDIYGQNGGFHHLVHTRRPHPVRAHPMLAH